MADEMGRPETTDEQYNAWLENMRPFLQNANSLYYAIEQAGLTAHKDTIYRKYRLKDWFCEKIDHFRTTPGELVNDAMATMVRTILDKAKRKEILTHEEIDILKFYAEKSRASQAFFVNRTETAQGKSVAEILHELDEPDTKNDVVEEIKKEDVGSTTTKQVVATDAPVQNQGQAGAVSDVPAKPDATPVQS